jgi:hypothetical protein
MFVWTPQKDVPGFAKMSKAADDDVAKKKKTKVEELYTAFSIESGKPCKVSS